MVQSGITLNTLELDRPLVSSTDPVTIPLCDLCQDFDVQCFSKSPHGLRGYSVEHVRAAAEQGCEFCAILDNCVKELPAGEWQKERKPYVHLSLWENYTRKIQNRQPNGLRANRLKVWVGGLNSMKPRRSEVAISPVEICLAADISTFIRNRGSSRENDAENY
jgi:hypothetical protein